VDRVGGGKREGVKVGWGDRGKQGKFGVGASGVDERGMGGRRGRGQSEDEMYGDLSLSSKKRE